MAKKYRTVSRADRKKTRKQYEESLNQIQEQVKAYDPNVNGTVTKFDQLPLTDETKKGLKEAGYMTLTDIQREAIPVCLKGTDVLGAAKTGSGKTLAFLVPTLERLMCERWGEFDGVGALIIAPTRELAVQIYEVLIKIGKHCSLSAGLVIGGKDYAYESERIGRINVLIGTPGRILQHMDESAQLNMNNLQMLVLDEADRILDMGFRKTLDSIVQELPPQRQTLLFSATQTQSVKDLARLSLVNPKYIATSTEQEITTPESLEQFYITTELQEKIDVLWSFLKSHLKTKILVFASSSKQVHFIYECFRKLRPGSQLMKLHGRQKEKARLETTEKFMHARNCCLFATDVVARGLDFPGIDWVVQLDCPESASTYIHRVGRSARYGRAGKSLLFLTPNEEVPFLNRLKSKKIEAKKLNVKDTQKRSIRNQLQSLCFHSPELKYLGQKAFISYCKSVFIQGDKDVFDLSKLNLEEYASSMGLPGTPKVKFLEAAKKGKNLKDSDLEKLKAKKNASRRLLTLAKANDEGEFEETKKTRTKIDKMFERQNQNVLSEHYMQLTKDNGEEDDGDDFLTVRRNVREIDDSELPSLETILTSKRAQKRALSKKMTAMQKGAGSKMVFDDEGVAHPSYDLVDEGEFHEEGAAAELKKKFVTDELETMQLQDKIDKSIAKNKRDEKKRRRKELERLAMEGGESEGEEVRVFLGPPSGEESDEPDLDRDLERGAQEEEEEKSLSEAESEPEEDERPRKKKARTEIIEIQQPETIDDLEALTEKLINE